MKKLCFASPVFVCLLAGCILSSCQQPPEDLSLLIENEIEIPDAGTEQTEIPRFLPEGQKYEVEVVGFEASDGTFFPVLSVCQPIPRGGSTGPVSLDGRRIRILKGREPEASRNEMLGSFEADIDLEDVRVTFSLSKAGALSMTVEEDASGEQIALTRLKE